MHENCANKRWRIQVLKCASVVKGRDDRNGRGSSNQWERVWRDNVSLLKKCASCTAFKLKRPTCYPTEELWEKVKTSQHFSAIRSDVWWYYTEINSEVVQTERRAGIIIPSPILEHRGISVILHSTLPPHPKTGGRVAYTNDRQNVSRFVALWTERVFPALVATVATDNRTRASCSKLNPKRMTPLDPKQTVTIYRKITHWRPHDKLMGERTPSPSSVHTCATEPITDVAKASHPCAIQAAAGNHMVGSATLYGSAQLDYSISLPSVIQLFTPPACEAYV